MAEIVGSAFLSAFFQSLFDRLASQEVMNMFQGKKLISKQLKELKIQLLSADKLLDYAEEKQIEDPKVKKWLDELKEVIYLADELMDKVNNEALRCKLEGESSSGMTRALTKFIRSSFSAFDDSVRSELENILDELKSLMDQKDVLGLKQSHGKKHSNRLPAPLVEESDVYGRVSIKEAIVESLLMDDHASGHNVSVIPIVGIGGIGKTTLAQLVYNDHRVKEHFDHELKVWVTVSTEFDIFRIMKTILQKVTPQDCKNQDPQDVCFRLKEALAKKKFLIVLDDVWNEQYEDWDVLRNSLGSCMHGSKILVTTRSATVASIMSAQQAHHLQELSEEDGWKLFTKHAFNINEELEEYSDLQEIGKEIVKKCKGNPLAVKSLGGVLHSERNPRKWKEILKSNMWELYEKNRIGILPALWLSYYYLPSCLKRCFGYCSVFPKDYFFKREEMTLLWMAEGFLPLEAARNGIEDVGEQYFEELISRSLLQRSNEDESRFVMHDLVHDLAMYVSGEFCFRLDEDKISHNLGSKTRHFSSGLAVDDLKKFEDMSKAKRLHTFIQFEGIGLGEPACYLNQLTTIGCLRVLSICGSQIKELPDSIGNLTNLRYLKLMWTRIVKLPDSICTLYNLQTLILYYCRSLAELPKNIGNLINLRHINIQGCHELGSIPDSICSLHNLQTLLLKFCEKPVRLPTNMGHLINLRHLDTSGSQWEEMPPGISNLKGLETLSDFVLSKYGGANIKELGELQQLHGRLRISGLQNVNDVEDAIKANLKDKRNLNVLVLEWKGNTDNSIQERELLQALEPQTNLSEISISGYGGTSFPLWVGNSAFSKMVTMRLYDCPNCCLLPPLGNLPFLRELRIHNFHAVETISDEFYGVDSPFRSLEKLRFKNMPEWNKWSFGEGKEDGAFPRLKTLSLMNCPKLSGGLPITSHTIETLTIEKCGKLEIPENHAYTALRDLTIESFHSLKFFPLDKALELRKLNLVDCESSESLTFREEPLPVLQSLRFLKLSGWAKLVSFPKGGLPASKLKELQISKCKNLRSLPEQMRTLLPSLESLQVYDCPELKSFPEGGLPSNLKQLQILRCSELMSTYMHWDLQRLSSLESLTVDGCEDVLESFPPQGLLPTSLTSLDIRNFRHLKALNSNAVQHLNLLRICWCPELQCLRNESLLNSLQSLSMYDCPLLEQRYQREKGEDWHKISHIRFISTGGKTTKELENVSERRRSL